MVVVMVTGLAVLVLVVEGMGTGLAEPVLVEGGVAVVVVMVCHSTGWMSPLCHSFL